jgi:hypothetical protein
MLGKSFRIATIVIAVVVIAAVSFALAAVAASPSAGKAKSTTIVSIASSGKLTVSPFGPGATVAVTYQCFPGFGGKGGYSGFAVLTLGDLQGNQGSGTWAPICTDSRQTALVFVPGAFVAGDAAANSFICGFDCNGTSREIRLR